MDIDKQMMTDAITQALLDLRTRLLTKIPNMINNLRAAEEENEGDTATLKITGALSIIKTRNQSGLDVAATGKFGSSVSVKTDPRHVGPDSQPQLPLDGTVAVENPDTE